MGLSAPNLLLKADKIEIGNVTLLVSGSDGAP